MTSTIRGLSTLALVAALAGASFVAARFWQGQQDVFERTAAPSDCVLQNGPCEQLVDGAPVRLAITPETIPLMQTLTLEVDVGDREPSQVAVDIRGLNMDMGLNRTVLALSEEGGWRGETILPVCSQRRMEWEAAVQIETNKRFEVPFLFSTVRP